MSLTESIIEDAALTWFEKLSLRTRHSGRTTDKAIGGLAINGMFEALRFGRIQNAKRNQQRLPLASFRWSVQPPSVQQPRLETLDDLLAQAEHYAEYCMVRRGKSLK